MSNSLGLDDQRDLFQFFKCAFIQEPTEEFVEGILRLGEQAPSELKAFISRCVGLEVNEICRRLKADYARLFYGMGNNPVPPYESVFVGDLPLLAREQRDQVVEDYARYGYVARKTEFGREDHIALECDFCSRLCDVQRDRAENGDEDGANEASQSRERFVADHLAVWIPQFCDQVIEADSRRIATHPGELGFYSAVAKMLCAFVKELAPADL